jgi:uncharacterized protein YggE
MKSILKSALILVALAVPGAAQAAEGHTVAVWGSGAATAAPDEARFTVAAAAQAVSAEEAMAQAAEKGRAVLGTLKRSGIAAGDIQTGTISVHPIYGKATRRDIEVPVVVAYRAGLSQSVRVRDLGTLGGVLQAVATAGAGQVGGVRFSLADTAALDDAARTAAMADAARAAAVLARAAGRSLGPVVSISEEGGGPGPRPVMALRAEAASAGVPVEAGEITVEVRVRVVYQLAPN